MILIKGKYRPKNDFYFCYIFHVSKIVSFRLREEKRLLRHFADPRRLGVYRKFQPTLVGFGWAIHGTLIQTLIFKYEDFIMVLEQKLKSMVF